MTWKLAGKRAKLETDSIDLAIDLLRPRDGLLNVTFDGQKLPALKPLQLTAHPPVAAETVTESYVRGPDLIATYAQLPARTVRPQYCYRALDSRQLRRAGCVGVELLIGLQTSLLDGDPTCSSVTEAAVQQVYALGEAARWTAIEQTENEFSPADCVGTFLFRLQQPAVSYVEIVFPTDFQGAQLALRDGVATLSYQMFPEFLEKGVIRKGRVWAVLTPREGDLEAAVACFQRLLAAPPPLTV